MNASPQPLVTFRTGSPMRQFRMIPLRLGGQRAMLSIHSDCPSVDPWHRSFFLPNDTLKLTAFSADGQRLWQRDLGGGMIPGAWYCPVYPFDLDGDGEDEVWLVGNRDPEHPLNFDTFTIERLAGRTGERIAWHPWPRQIEDQAISHSFRNFFNGGFSRGRRRLITAQGTYGRMQIQCWDESFSPLWERVIPKGDPGPLGSHMFPVVDIDGDGRDELFWGERCVDLDSGQDRWVADGQSWRGHSDVIQPTLDLQSGRWRLFTCREADAPGGAVVMFDDRGEELWGHRGMGHMHKGWTARLREDLGHVCYVMEIGERPPEPGGTRPKYMKDYLYDIDGRPLELPFPLQGTLPVDFNGDGRHELVYSSGERCGQVVDFQGNLLAQLEGTPAVAGKLLDVPGEQVVTWDADGTIRLYACGGAVDAPQARRRYEHPYYAACQRLSAVGYNLVGLGGL